MKNKLKIKQEIMNKMVSLVGSIIDVYYSVPIHERNFAFNYEVAYSLIIGMRTLQTQIDTKKLVLLLNMSVTSSELDKHFLDYLKAFHNSAWKAATKIPKKNIIKEETYEMTIWVKECIYYINQLVDFFNVINGYEK